jgi:hypothetical protein
VGVKRYYLGAFLLVSLVAAPVAAGAAGRTLPLTGMPIWPILALAGALFGTGLLLFISDGRSRRREGARDRRRRTAAV